MEQGLVWSACGYWLPLGGKRRKERRRRHTQPEGIRCQGRLHVHGDAVPKRCRDRFRRRAGNGGADRS
eukprot:12898776-Prorocentrum_lima.AAC.1